VGVREFLTDGYRGMVVSRRVAVRAGALVMEAEQPYLDVETAPNDGPVGLADAAVRYRLAVGPLAGQRTMRLRVPTLAADPRRTDSKP
jgi:hypothetical protein